MTKSIILFHGDVDGLYSGLLFYKTNKDEIQIDEVRSIDYGQDHSTLKTQYDNFFVFDFAENPGEERTTLWVDHHIKQEEAHDAALSIFKESPSCVRLMYDSDIIDKSLIGEEYLGHIDSVDSASYKWGPDFTKEDLIFPDLNKNTLNQFVALNQLLRKNRKSGLAEKLFATEFLDVEKLIAVAERDRGPKTVKHEEIMSSRKTLMNKIINDTDDYIQVLSGIPVLFTKNFTKQDWKGYELNILGYIMADCPYLITVFDFSSGVNIQIATNAFYDGIPFSLYKTIQEEIDDPRGHDGIINMSFANGELAAEKMDKLIALLSSKL